MKKLITLILLSLPIISGCDVYDDYAGTIMITATEECNFKILTVSDGRMIVSGVYEPGRAPTIVSIKSTGIYIIYAQTYNGKKTHKRPLNYPGGNLEYHIEF